MVESGCLSSLLTAAAAGVLLSATWAGDIDQLLHGVPSAGTPALYSRCRRSAAAAAVPQHSVQQQIVLSSKYRQCHSDS